MDILQGLNKKQRLAAAHIDGAILVVAGPGTGKTRVITHRIAHLIRNHQVPAQEILAVTFTNKAAQEMLERVKTLLGRAEGLDVQIDTFHAYCTRLLREHASKVGLSRNFTIFDQKTQDEILMECLRELRHNRHTYPPWLLRRIIGTYKIELENATALREEIQTADGTVITDETDIQSITELINAYEKKLANHNALDFDDLIFNSVKLLDSATSIRGKIQRDLRFILVDEYQDVNTAQYSLLKHLSAAPHYNVMVVADEDQSIYSWRGSNPKYIEQFQADFHSQIVELDEHYRCSEKILQSAQAVISQNTRQKKSNLKTLRESPSSIYHYLLDSPEEEARLIVKLVRQLVDQRNYSYGDIAIFYRTHQLADVLQDCLHQNQLLFQRVGRTNSFQEEHAKDIVSYLNFIQWQLPQDIQRAINFPQQLIDDLTLARLKWKASRKGITLVEMLRKIDDYQKDVGPLTRWHVRQFFDQINRLEVEIRDETINMIATRLFDFLACRRTPYRSEDLREIESQPEIAGIHTATGVLYNAIDRGKPVRVVASYEIDAYCAAYIIQQTFARYLNIKLRTHLLLPDNVGIPPIEEDVINILIGDFTDLPKTEESAIFITSESYAPDENVIQLYQSPKLQAKSVIALKLCQRLLRRLETPNLANMIVYDLETVGNHPKSAEIIEIGAKRLNSSGDGFQTYHQLVKPSCYIPKSSTKIHGIDNKMVQNEPDIEAVLPSFLNFIQDQILVGHNITEFDNHVLERNLGRYLGIGLPNPCYDTLVTARRLYPRENCKLEALAEKFKINYDTIHRAINDVQLTHHVFDELIKEDLRRREIRALTECLPLVGIGILASNKFKQFNKLENSGITKGDGLEEQLAVTEGNPKGFFQASARYIQCHNPNLDCFSKSLQPTEKQWVKEFINTLYRTRLPMSPEDSDWESRRAKFMNGLLYFEENSSEKRLSDFLDYQRLTSGADEIHVEADKITLMTLHAAKGTEFRVGIIMGMEEGTFPIQQKDQILSEIEEERRLFYVGMTRTQERLYLTSVTRRYGDSERATSRFVRDVPPNLMKRWSPRRHSQS